jgi:hypothetical protein
VIDDAKRKYNENFLKTSTNISKSAWLLVKRELGVSRSAENPEIVMDDRTVSEPCEVANLFNDYFSMSNDFNGNLPMTNCSYTVDNANSNNSIVL